MKVLSNELLRSPQRMILLSFLAVIGIGTALLMQPFVMSSGSPLSFVDALFTATSATCVTGLVVNNVALDFSTSGQWIILILIQIGGLGIMTFSTFFMALFVGRISVAGKDVIIDTFSQNPILELGKLIKVIFTFTIVLEFAGWLMLSVIFLQHYSFSEALYQGLFHSISSYCNAGFSIMDGGYLNYSSNWFFSGVSMLLIIAGGLGFMVIFDFNAQLRYPHKGIFRRLSLHSKIVLLSTMVLIVAGSLLFYVLEFSNSLKDQNFSDQVLTSVFQSVTTRTAGFNTIGIDLLSEPTLFVLILFMLIGTSPGSCGGGIKTTTFVLFLQYLKRQFSNNKDINLMKRRIPETTLNRAVSIVFFAIFTVCFFVFLLLVTETHINPNENTFSLSQILFEVVSAFGTVGLSTGITPFLSIPGKLLITLLMFIGRLGPLTLVFALKSKTESGFRYMQEDILVG